jgi:hypothetical protein
MLTESEKNKMKEKEYPFTAEPKKIGGGSKYVIIPSYFFNEGILEEGKEARFKLVVKEE